MTETEPLRLAAAGDAKPAWITLLTTEHYNLQTQRASTVAETNGRAGVFLGSVSSGLVALGFSGQGEGSDVGLVVVALSGSVPAALAVGAVAGVAFGAALISHQGREWRRSLGPAITDPGRVR